MASHPTCIIIGPLYSGEEADWLRPGPGDLVIAADGGYDAAISHGIRPDLVIGDFDSMPFSHVSGCEVIRLPVRKDDTDTVVCLRTGRERGYTHFRLAGCLGGRLDHTLSNLQSACDCALRGEEVWLCDSLNRVTMLCPGSYDLPAMPGRLFSILAYTPIVKGVCLEGTLWPLDQAELSARYPLGCSNEAIRDSVRLSFTEGMLIVIWSVDHAKDTLKEDTP